MSVQNPTYDPGIPERNDFLANSQEEMLINFSNLSTAFSNNHVGFFSSTQTNSVDAGKHTYVELVTRFSSIPQTKLGEISLYTSEVNDGTDSIPQLFLSMQNNSSNQQYTAYQDIPSKSNSRYTFIPGGFIWYFGTVQMKGGTATVNLSPAPNSKSGKILYAGAQKIGNTAVNYISVSPSSSSVVNFFDTKASPRNFNGPIYFNVIAILGS